MRRFYSVINDPVDYVPGNTDTNVSKSAFNSAQEAQSTNALYASAYISAPENGPPIRSEHGFKKMNPYMEAFSGPFGSGLAPESDMLRSISGYANVYHLSNEIPHIKLPRLLVQIDWPEQDVKWTLGKIDRFMPPYLYDRRMDEYAATTAMRNMIYNPDFALKCPWMPLSITEVIISRKEHMRYCAIVCRLYLLERIVYELKKNVSDQSTFNILTEEVHNSKFGDAECRSADKIMGDQERIIMSAIKEASKWQDTMMGTAMYMEEKGRYTDAEIKYDFEESADCEHASVYDTGLHWVMHDGELPDISSTIPHFPYWSPAEVRRQRSKRSRGRSTEAGAIGDMRGTPFESDPYVCAVMTIMKHGIPQPNQIRNADIVISDMIRKFKGRDDSEEDKAQVLRAKFMACVELMSDMLVENAYLYKTDVSSRNTSVPEKLASDQLRFVGKCKEIFLEMSAFNDKRLGGDDSRLVRCCRTNRNKLRDAITTEYFPDVVQHARAFLGMIYIDVDKVDHSSDSDDDMIEEDLFAEPMIDSHLPSAGGSTRGNGRYRSSWMPKSCSVKQKSIQTRDHTVSTSSGGHNAHRLLDFMMRIIGITLMGRYEDARVTPNFYTVKEIYRLIQFDYPSIEDFCAWLETPFPEDIKKHANKRPQVSAARAAAEASSSSSTAEPTPAKKSTGVGKKPRKKKVNGSDIRRYFVVYVIREFHIHAVKQMPGLWETFVKLYKWSEIVVNISETCDSIRFLVNRFIRDLYEHNSKCNHPNASFMRAPNKCQHCERWKIIEKDYPKKLVELYKRWPILYAIDMAARWKPDSNETTPVRRLSNRPTYIQSNHKEFLLICWRPAMRLFPRNALDNITYIDSIMTSVQSVIEKFTPKKTKSGLLKRTELVSLSHDAVEHYKNTRDKYSRTMRDEVTTMVKLIVSKFKPGSNIGSEWLMLIGVKINTILLMREAQMSVEYEDKRSEAYFKLLEILAFNGMDFFILKTFYNVLVNYNNFHIRYLDANTLRTQVNSIARKLGPDIIDITKPIPECFTKFYVCTVHGKLNAALVGTELGEEGYKNTKSSGHNDISVDHSMAGGGGVFCTTSGKRVDKREASDAIWDCMKQANVEVDMLGSLLQVYDTIYVMCPHCGNPMEYRWERFCCGDLVMWCGQCIAGKKKMALQNGLIWKGKSVTSCARTNMIGGIYIASDMCPYCTNCRASPETMEYHLLWDDTDPSGNHKLVYYPVCSAHERPYQSESWALTSLHRNKYIIPNAIRSVVIDFRRPKLPVWYDVHDPSSEFCEPGEDERVDISSNGTTRLSTIKRVPIRLFVRSKRAPRRSRAYENRVEKKRKKEELSKLVTDEGKTIERPRSNAKMQRDLKNKIKRRVEKRGRKNKKRARRS
jgi:hypothetical protein